MSLVPESNEGNRQGRHMIGTSGDHSQAGRKHGRHPDKALSAAFVRTATKPGRYCDGQGLYLLVLPSGARCWVQRLVIGGRRRELGLGGFPLVTLAEAREVAFGNRKRARAGGDPLADKRHRQGTPTFEEAARQVWEQQRAGWRNQKTVQGWIASLRNYAFPHIGGLPVGAVTMRDVLGILTPIWHAKPDTARLVRQRIGAVMKWAVVMEYRPDNPAGEILGQALGRQHAVVQHHRALPHAAVAAAVQTVRASNTPMPVKLAFEFLVLTAARSGEVRLATWDEIDCVAAEWTIPAARMKAQRAHRVPLSPSAVAILDAARALGDGTGLLFPRAHSGTPVPVRSFWNLMHQLGIASLPHGFRSSFRDWAAEQTNARQDVIEASLAHVVRDPTVAAYARSDLFERRRRLLDDWAAYLGTETDGGGR